jgi:hypothetical protein
MVNDTVSILDGSTFVVSDRGVPWSWRSSAATA